MLDYYNILAVPQDASTEQIRKSYRQLAKRHHPDANPNSTGTERAGQEGNFIRLAKAYRTLSDPAQRAAYDRQWRTAFAHKTQRAQPRGRPRAERASSTAGDSQRPAGGRGGASAEQNRTGSSSESRRRQSTETGPDLQDLLDDAASLLSAFGLDLRQPFQVLLDALMGWAKSVFEEVTAQGSAQGNAANSATSNGTASADQSGAGGGTASQKKAHAKADSAGTRTRKNEAGGTPRAATGSPHEGASGTSAQQAGGARSGKLPEQEVEKELTDIKKSVRRQGRKSRPAESSIEQELAEIKRRKGTKGTKGTKPQ